MTALEIIGLIVILVLVALAVGHYVGFVKVSVEVDRDEGPK